MIRIMLENISDEINIKGLIECGCKSCKKSIEAGHGNPKHCETCAKNNIEYYFINKQE
ncbi:hypothetical protein [Clostridium pasteurianum]|uniref:Uncharacterized protein n=1 Tax=Clostridium pasteurianum BC1 TaxID=86416 RepID=R4K787_CLOPA|nr:hypothetical protein [Clostridium pasteurianum]AGK99022.1 hypothetical protein Clopa_4303 [Clostridium pasteurianum BC1]